MKNQVTLDLKWTYFSYKGKRQSQRLIKRPEGQERHMQDVKREEQTSGDSPELDSAEEPTTDSRSGSLERLPRGVGVTAFGVGVTGWGAWPSEISCCRGCRHRDQRAEKALRNKLAVYHHVAPKKGDCLITSAKPLL